MLNKTIKASFAVVGGITGFTLTNTMISIVGKDIANWLKLGCIFFAILFCAILFYLIANKITEAVFTTFDWLENKIHKMTLYELTLSSVGSIIGLIIANLVVIPIRNLDVIGLPLAIFANILLGSMFFGIGIAVGRKNEGFIELFKSGKIGRKNENDVNKRKLLDTSIIIDGRLVDILKTGFLDSEFTVPSFVLEELRHIADSSDPIKRNRGRRGLDILNVLQKEFTNNVRIEDMSSFEGAEVDDKLLKAANSLGSIIVTIDYNLAKVAECHGVQVLNINDLANALKPIAIPGEEMLVHVIKDGKENGQGVGYLDDGTMIVIEGGRKYIGESINVMVTSILQTSAGRMIFAKPNFQMEKAI